MRKRVGAFVFAFLFLLGGAAEALAQRVRVYNPGRYSRTRQMMSNRAAARAARKRKRQRRHARRRALRRAVS